jgi:CRISPR/Cas system-associated exonuclease Cas4 (RecB family)
MIFSQFDANDPFYIKMYFDSLFMDREGLEKLLHLEKQRRGVDENSLVFIGMADVAAYYWCAMKSLYKNRKMELAFFASYLYDRLSYSLQLGLIKNLPQSPEEILRIGDEIGFNDIEQLLKERAVSEDQAAFIKAGKVIVDEHGDQFLVINPALSLEDIDLLQQWAKNRGIRVVNFDEAPPTVQGEIIEAAKAERYPTIRWNFAWDKYVVVGVPDGITNEFVYEFKTTKSKFLMNFLKPVALTQADLYGYFFKRNRKRVQIYIAETGEIETWEVPVDIERAKTVLAKFKEVEMGLTPLPPKAWKCKSCEFAEVCTLRAG